jgi:hypothetical protein
MRDALPCARAAQPLRASHGAISLITPIHLKPGVGFKPRRDSRGSCVGRHTMCIVMRRFGFNC